MNPVRAAISEFQRRGYVEHATGDTAVVDFGEGALTGVVLTWGKTGTFIDSFHVAALMIVVVTCVDRTSGSPTTKVTAGM